MKRFIKAPMQTNLRRVPPKKQFEGFKATELYCPNCKASMRVRERLLLVLPEGDKYEYICARCGASLGDRIVREAPKPALII
ncbi:MAG: cytoplasmic protein [Desulfomonilaceae bacterium]